MIYNILEEFLGILMHIFRLGLLFQYVKYSEYYCGISRLWYYFMSSILVNVLPFEFICEGLDF